MRFAVLLHLLEPLQGHHMAIVSAGLVTLFDEASFEQCQQKVNPVRQYIPKLLLLLSYMVFQTD